jgi:hypothetical protein
VRLARSVWTWRNLFFRRTVQMRAGQWFFGKGFAVTRSWRFSQSNRDAWWPWKAKRLMTIPGVGAIVATALVALAPDPRSFRRGRDFAAWIGLTPLQHSSGGKERLGRTSKMGERTLRRLLIIGASSAAKAAARKDTAPSTWLKRMLARKPRMLVVVALANKLARVAWRSWPTEEPTELRLRQHKRRCSLRPSGR